MIRGAIPAFAWTDWGITDVLAEIRTQYLPNTSTEHHHYTNLLGNYKSSIYKQMFWTNFVKLNSIFPAVRLESVSIWEFNFSFTRGITFL
jgi:hypothetical protein